ncbi:hypothetical protein ABT112_02755 [Streptomyces sp. NPDC002055]|uniref:hypothetical protein n=1 Tax=Streptomyces sp. NPDC002055 TaxID=3154534 RepID=UPI00331AEE14
MNRELQKFIRVYLNLEEAYDTGGYLRPTLHAFKHEYVEAVQHGLESVLNTRELSVGDYEGLTDIEFPNEDALYDYLKKMYRYLFEDEREQPLPPE